MFGFELNDISGQNQIDSLLKNLYVSNRGFATATPFGSTTNNVPVFSGEYLVGVRPLTYGQLLSLIAIDRVNGLAGVQFEYIILRQMDEIVPNTFGLAVYDDAGQLVFSDDRTFFNVDAIFDVAISNGVLATGALTVGTPPFGKRFLLLPVTFAILQGPNLIKSCQFTLDSETSISPFSSTITGGRVGSQSGTLKIVTGYIE